MKYLALYMAPVAEMEKMMAEPSKEKMKESLAEWRTWMESKGKAFVDEGAALGKNKRVNAQGVMDHKNDVGGFSIVEAATAEDAAAIFMDSPHFEIPGAYVDVLPIVPMEG